MTSGEVLQTALFQIDSSSSTITRCRMGNPSWIRIIHSSQIHRLIIISQRTSSSKTTAMNLESNNSLMKFHWDLGDNRIKLERATNSQQWVFKLQLSYQAKLISLAIIFLVKNNSAQSLSQITSFHHLFNNR